MVQLAVPEIEDTYSSSNATTNNSSVPSAANIPNSGITIAVPEIDENAETTSMIFLLM